MHEIQENSKFNQSSINNTLILLGELIKYLHSHLSISANLFHLTFYQLIYISLIYSKMQNKGSVLAYMGLLNGMVGGTILILPLIGLKTGYILIPIVSFIFGSISFYTCYLMLTHLGQAPTIKDSVKQHFNNRKGFLMFYDLVLGCSFIGLLINYFKLIMNQLQGFIPKSTWLPIAVVLILLSLTIIMRYYHFGEKLLAIGILSVIAYVSFLVWAQASAPQGTKTLPATGPYYTELASSLIMGYSIHNIVAQVLLRTTTNDIFIKIVFFVFLSGFFVYTFITYGAYAIINRQPRNSNPETISQYFQPGSWQVRTIQAIYLFHLLTATPQFCLIMKTNFLQLLRIEEGPQITLPQMTIYILLYSICYLMYVLKVKISTIIELNGSILGFTYIFLIPIAMHIKCIFFTKKNDHGEIIYQEIQPDGTVVAAQGKCKCNIGNRTTFVKVAETILQVGILAIGVYTVTRTLRLLFFATQSQTAAAQL